MHVNYVATYLFTFEKHYVYNKKFKGSMQKSHRPTDDNNKLK